MLRLLITVCISVCVCARTELCVRHVYRVTRCRMLENAFHSIFVSYFFIRILIPPISRCNILCALRCFFSLSLSRVLFCTKIVTLLYEAMSGDAKDLYGFFFHFSSVSCAVWLGARLWLWNKKAETMQSIYKYTHYYGANTCLGQDRKKSNDKMICVFSVLLCAFIACFLLLLIRLQANWTRIIDRASRYMQFVVLLL